MLAGERTIVYYPGEYVRSPEGNEVSLITMYLLASCNKVVATGTYSTFGTFISHLIILKINTAKGTVSAAMGGVIPTVCITYTQFCYDYNTPQPCSMRPFPAYNLCNQPGDKVDPLMNEIPAPF